MAYWLDDGFDTWSQVLMAGTAPAGLYTRCGSWIARSISNGDITDAVVPSALARLYGTSEWIQRLVDVGLWAVEGDGYRDTRYFELNPTAEKVRANREKKAAAGRAGGVASGASRRSKQTPKQNGSTPEAGASSVVEPPSLPLPSSKEGRGRADLHLVRDWCGRCHKDTRNAVDDSDRSVPCPNCHPRHKEAS
jgi:hypothetical protein